ncbi:hypothetical protein Clacol_007651 [Clathrus columnatus]|uniref:Mannose-P-dolichol utilization defect 1 protein homolog n=1 Tax=Clathrus columnatus TaxID=1419009 RepID=A0AAV5AFI2_9AGAM|nr:hypothetical protein Clacol_007651 [Clathrus columnatus]
MSLITIIGEKCYVSLIENLNITDVECVKFSISKGLGIGIVIGGSIMKVPQLILILRARSARGLSLPSYILETLSYAITLAYSARNAFPFSTYGENLFLTLQNVVITLLIIHHAPPSNSHSLTRRPNSSPKLIGGVALSVIVSYILAIIPMSLLALLQMATIPLSLLSKFPQIYENQQARSTGQLSAVAVISQVAGCLARLFTTATEVKDPIVFAGFFLAFLLNLILGAQMYMFWGHDAEDKVLGGTTTIEREKASLEKIVVSPQAPIIPPQRQVQTPPPGGKKWARKLD